MRRLFWMAFTLCDVVSYLVLVGLILGVVPATLHAGEGPQLQPQLPRSGQISTYDTQGHKVDFAGSWHDGELQRGLEWPEPRFLVNGDGTITDRLTGLMWLLDGGCLGQVTWPFSRAKIGELNNGEVNCHDYTADYSDWFLPDIKQVSLLINAEEASNRNYLYLNGFSNLDSTVYWSATQYVNVQNAWTVNIENGAITFRDKLEKASLLPVRLSGPAGAVASKNISRVELENKTVSPPDGVPVTVSRFVDNGDGTVTDTRTGLMWLKDASCFQNLDWATLFTTVKALNDASSTSQCRRYHQQYADWVVPNRVELWSLIDQQFDYPALEAGFFERLQGGYWSSTTAASMPQQAFSLDMDDGELNLREKADLLRLLPVRYAHPTLQTERKKSSVAAGLETPEEYILVVNSELRNEIHWPPSPRFVLNGDGTSTDVVTGYDWLTDGSCFGKKSWSEAKKLIQEFNREARKFECLDYAGGYDDWQLPALIDFKELIEPGTDDAAVWLNSQGVTKVQSSGDYWTLDETLINLYYAYVVNLKTGNSGNYPKSLDFFVWPRRSKIVDEKTEPLLSLTVNGETEQGLTVESGNVLSISILLYSFGLRYPADFWFWYETPDQKKLWMTSIRTWKEVPTTVYQGDLLNLRQYEILRTSEERAMGPGEYTFHFAVDTIKNGIWDGTQYETAFTVFVKAASDQ